MSFMFKHLHWGHCPILSQAQTHFLLPNHSFPTLSLVHHIFPEAVFLLDHIKVENSYLPNCCIYVIFSSFSDLGELNPKLYVQEAETQSQFKMKIAMKYSVQQDCLVVNIFRFFVKEVFTF